jgi:hypothetical protein
MKTARGGQCEAEHSSNGLKHLEDVIVINGRRYAVCAHPVGNTYCGALIDVTGRELVLCCGDDKKHSFDDGPFGTF